MRNKKAVQGDRLQGRSAESDFTIMGRSVASHLDVAIDEPAKNPRPEGRFPTLTSLASMILVVAGPDIVICAASKSFEVLGLMLMLRLAGVVTGVAIFSFRPSKLKSYTLLVTKNVPYDIRYSPGRLMNDS